VAFTHSSKKRHTHVNIISQHQPTRDFRAIEAACIFGQLTTPQLRRRLKTLTRKIARGVDRFCLDDTLLDLDPRNKRLQSSVRWGVILYRRRLIEYDALLSELCCRNEDISGVRRWRR